MGKVGNIGCKPRSDDVRMDRCKRGQTKRVIYGIVSTASNSWKSSNPHSGVYQATTARTIDANGGNPVCNQGGIIIVEMLDCKEGSMNGIG